MKWISDIHLNFLSPQEREAFYETLRGDSVLITGDIAESQNVVYMLKEMKTVVKEVYFVLGNHDFYGSSVPKVKRSVKSLGYLPQAPVELNSHTILLGVDGWGDCRNGNFESSRFAMSDWLYIDELRIAHSKGMDKLKKALQKLADADAEYLKKQVLSAMERGYTKIIIATHVPPFEEICLNAGKKSCPDSLPFFSSKCLGDTILPIAKKHPKVDFLWLSGHTHSRAKFKPCNNMTVKVAKAQYGYPQIEGIIYV